jgi:hypothetical protein
MKTSTPLPRRTSSLSSRRHWRKSRERYSRSIGEARPMVGDPHDGARAEVRAGCHFAAAIGLRSLLEDYAPTIPTGPTINTHSPVASLAVVSITSARKARGWSRHRPRRSLRGQSLPAVGDRAAEQVSLCCREARVIFVCAVSVCC